MNACSLGQPIRLALAAAAPPKRNPFDTAHMPGRSLADRITRPRSLSPPPLRYTDNDRVDRYVPGRGSRSPLPRRRGGGGGGGGGGGSDRGGGRRPGARREATRQQGQETAAGGQSRGRDGRPRKTAEELDAEMADYFQPNAGGGGSGTAAPVAAGTTEASSAGGGGQVGGGDDVDMIE